MRRATVTPLARRTLDAYVSHLESLDPKSWPQFLKLAWLLIENKLDNPDKIKEIVVESVKAAHACAVAAASRRLSNGRTKSRQAVAMATARLGNCITDTRAALRQELNDAAQHNFSKVGFNSETIESFLICCCDVLLKFPADRNAAKMLTHLGWTESKDEKYPPASLLLINDYDAMHPMDRQRIEIGLSQMLDAKNARLSALSIFSLISENLEVPFPAEFCESSRDLNIHYVSNVASIWRNSQLRPARSHLLDKPNHRSEFHQFLELVIRDHFDLNPRRPKNLPENRYEWLISDEDLKIVLAADSENLP